jgi:hypothetical protein
MAAIMRLSAIGPGRFSSRHGRLGAQVSRALGQPADRHLEGRIGAQSIAVIGILIAGRDQQRPEADHLGEPVLDPLGRPWIFEAARQARGDAEAPLDFGQNQNTAIRGQPSGVEGDVHRLAGDG